MVRIFFRRNKCIGCNACVELNHNRWRLSRRDGKCTLVNGIEKGGVYRVNVNDDEYSSGLKAAENCPVKIIHVEMIKLTHKMTDCITKSGMK
jgi:ferredoxin